MEVIIMQNKTTFLFFIFLMLPCKAMEHGSNNPEHKLEHNDDTPPLTTFIRVLTQTSDFLNKNDIQSLKELFNTENPTENDIRFQKKILKTHFIKKNQHYGHRLLALFSNNTPYTQSPPSTVNRIKIEANPCPTTSLKKSPLLFPFQISHPPLPSTQGLSPQKAKRIMEIMD